MSKKNPSGITSEPLSAFATKIKKEFDEYFSGTRKKFTIPYTISGSAHQRRVWQQITAIPYGTVESYGDIATCCQSGARAVGNACGSNTLLLLIPCHRVVAKNGIGGYSAMKSVDYEKSVAVKRQLLALERAVMP